MKYHNDTKKPFIKKDISQILSKKIFRGFEGYDLGRLLYIRINKTDKRKLNNKQWVFIFLSGIIRRSHVKSNFHNGSNIYVSDKRVERQNYSTIEKNLFEIDTKMDSIVLYYRNRVHIDFSMYLAIANWYKTFKHIGIPKYMVPLLIYDLIEVYSIKQEIKSINLESYKTLTVLFDSRPSDNFLVQFAQKQNLVTVSLQHGHYFFPRNEDSVYSGTPFANFTADYLLAWSDYTKDEAVLAGIDPNRIIVCGNPEQICANIIEKKIEERSFVLYLDADQFINRNIEMIEICSILANEFEWTLKIRFHPASNIEKYNDYIKTGTIIIDRGELNTNIISDAPFIITSGSSVIITAACIKTPILRYNNEGTFDDCYPGLQFLSFHDLGSGRKLFKAIQDDIPEINQNVQYLFNKLGIDGSVKEKYEAFYNRFQ